MIRTVLLALVALALLPAAASAHPLGNFSVNHLSRVSVSSDRVDVRYVLDEAEIPTFQQRGVADAELLRRKREEVERRLVLTVDGRRVPLRPAGAGRRLAHPPARAASRPRGSSCRCGATVDSPRRVALRDGTFPGRAGWKAIVVAPGEGTAVRSSVPAGDPTDGLRRYPEDVARARRRAQRELRRHAGAGTVQAPDGRRSAAAARADDGLTAAFSDAAAGRGRADPAAAQRVRLGSDPRALAGPRQGDGRRLPGRHARDRAARRRARRDR